MKTLIVVIFASMLILGTIHESHAQILPVNSRRFLSSGGPDRVVPGGPNACGKDCHHPSTYSGKTPPGEVDLAEYYNPPGY